MAARLSTCAYNLLEYHNRLDQSDHFNVRSVCFIDSQSFLCFGTSGRRAIISSVSSIGGEMVQKINHISLENESVQLWKWEEVKRHSAIILSDLLMYIYKHDHAITARWELAYKVNLKEHLLMGMPGRIVDIWIDLGIHRLFYIFQDEDLTAVKQCVVSINDDEHVVNITPGLTLYTLHVLVDQLYSDHVLYTIDLGDSGYTLTANTHAIGRVFRSSFQSLGLLCDVNDSSSIQFVSSNQFISGMEGAKKSMSATTFVHVRVNDRLYRIRCDMNSRMTGLSLVGSIALPIVGKEVSVLVSNESTIFVLSSCRHRSTTAMNIEKLDLFRWDIALGEYTITSIPLEMAARGPLSAIVQAGLHFEVDDSGTRSICTALGLADGKLLCLHGVSREAGDLNNWTLLQVRLPRSVLTVEMLCNDLNCGNCSGCWQPPLNPSPDLFLIL